MRFERLKNLREDSDLTQSKVAEYLHIAQRTYSGYEIGSRSIPIESLSRLADLYNTSVDYLIGRTDNKTPYR